MTTSSAVLPPPTETLSSLDALDITVIVLILGLVMAFGLYASLITNDSTCCHRWLPKRIRNRSPSPKRSDLLPTDSISSHEAENFFLADRSMSFYLVGASLFASNIGSEHFVGQAGDGARRGLGVAMYELYAAFLLLLLGWVFAPIYRRARVYTTPEFLEYRFSPACRHYLSIVTCIMYVVTKMSASIYGGAVILSATLGWDLYWSAGICIALSLVYTIMGGLRAVMFTDFIQTIIFVTGGFFIMGYALIEVGGIEGLKQRLVEQKKDRHWHIFQPTDDPDYPWTGMMIGQPIGSIWYWCMDQDLVQRVLAAKDDVHAKGGCIFASVLKILPFFIIIIPGVVAGVLFDLSDTKHGPDGAYPVLLTNVMPHGVIGMMIASIMTAMMSSLDSVFNAGSSVVANDLYRQFRPNASAKTLVWVGRCATVVFAVLSFLWIPVLTSGESLYRKVVEFQGYLAPPIAIVLILGVCSARINHQGAIAALCVGGILGIVRLIVAVGYQELKGTFPSWIDAFFFMNFQHFALLLWLVSGSFCVAVSLATPAPTNVERFTIQWREIFLLSAEELTYPKWINTTIGALAMAVIAGTISICVVFG